MNPRIIAVDLIASVKSWGRSKGTLFWSLLFPVMLILIFGAIFSGVDETEYTVHIQDLDDSSWSNSFVEMLGDIPVLKVEEVPVGANITEYIKEKELAGAVVIPSGFGDTINMSFFDSNASVNVSF